MGKHRKEEETRGVVAEKIYPTQLPFRLTFTNNHPTSLTGS